MFIRIVFIIINFLIFNNAVYSCNCSSWLLDFPIREMGLMLKEMDNKWDELVFNGKLIAIEESTKNYDTRKVILRFEVIEYYNGTGRDTIDIITNYSSEACGFYAKPNTNTVIFAREGKDGKYNTSRSDCCRSTSQHRETERYNEFLRFFNVIKNKIDGDYIFNRTYSQYRSFISRRDTSDLETLRFSIKKGKLHGEWKVRNKRKEILEHGYFKNGERHGKWKTYSQKSSKLRNGYLEITTTEIAYQEGTIIETKAIIEDLNFDRKVIKRQIYEQ